jgi:quinol monooxygenase YgiN
VTRVLVVNRFRVDADGQETFRAELADAVAVLRGCTGFVDADAGRNVDDPTLWVLVTRWADVGSYRRALSSYDVKVSAVPLLSRALDEPTAYETVPPGSVPNEPRARELG